VTTEIIATAEVIDRLGRLETKADGNEKQHDAILKTQENMWTAIGDLRDKLLNRLPVWATLFIAFLTGICGTLAGALITVLRMR